MNGIYPSVFPTGKNFAISFVDDTDFATLSNVGPVYEAFDQFGIRSTKTVWPLRADDYSGMGPGLSLQGDTLEDADYRSFCLDLHRSGFEVAMHTASAGNSIRPRTIRAYNQFESIFGCSPVTNVMHGRNRENIHWGRKVVPGRVLSSLCNLFDSTPFEGHDEASAYFWGDICRERTRYVRLFDTLRTNTLAFDPATPFHDPAKPYVNWWFSSTYGAGPRVYAALREQKVERLRRDRGACIVHLYCRLYTERDGARYRVHPEFRSLLARLSRYSDGWFVPVATLLDRIRAVRDVQVSVVQNTVRVTNNSTERLCDLALHVPPHVSMLPMGSPLVRHADQVRVGDLSPGDSVELTSSVPLQVVARPQPDRPAYRRLLGGHLNRIAWEMWTGHRKLPRRRA